MKAKVMMQLIIQPNQQVKWPIGLAFSQTLISSTTIICQGKWCQPQCVCLAIDLQLCVIQLFTGILLDLGLCLLFIETFDHIDIFSHPTKNGAPQTLSLDLIQILRNKGGYECVTQLHDGVTQKSSYVSFWKANHGHFCG